MRTKQERREIVEETFEPGASVARVARAHGVNANQLFQWRKLYREGDLEVEDGSSTLLPVKVSDASVPQGGAARRRRRAVRAGTIDIDLGHARVRIEGAADASCVRAALELLVR